MISSALKKETCHIHICQSRLTTRVRSPVKTAQAAEFRSTCVVLQAVKLALLHSLESVAVKDSSKGLRNLVAAAAGIVDLL